MSKDEVRMTMAWSKITYPHLSTKPALTETNKYVIKNKMYHNVRFHAYPSTSANQKTTKPHLNLHLWKQKYFLENKMHHNIRFHAQLITSANQKTCDKTAMPSANQKTRDKTAKDWSLCFPHKLKHSNRAKDRRSFPTDK